MRTLLLVIAAVSLACSSGPDTTPADASASDASKPDGSATDAASKVETGTDAPGPSLQQHCVDKINEYRATLSLPPYARDSSKEACADGEAKTDALANTAHSAFGSCSEFAQNECPGYSS